MKNRIIELKKDCIVEVASSHFIKNGYEDTKLSEIAKESGVSMATIYDLFENKEGIFKAAISTKIKEAYAEFLNIEKEFDEPLIKLEKYVEFKFLQSKQYKENMIGLYNGTPWFFSKMVVNESLVEIESVLSEYFKQIDEKTPLKEKNYDLLAVLFMHYLQGYTNLFLRDKYDIDSKSSKDILNEFLHGVIQ